MAYANVGKDSKSSQQNDNVYQAVIMADTFSEKLFPLSDGKSEILLPIVNHPILEYTLRFLRLSDIRLVYIFCSNNADLIQNYIDSSSWSRDSDMQINLIISRQSLSLGDGLRELDSRGIIRHDFVLIDSPGIVSNIKLKNIIEEFRECYKNDKQLIMTQLFVEAKPGHKLRMMQEDVLMITDSNSPRILHYQKAGKRKIDRWPTMIFKENDSVSMRFDLYDCHISICSPKVLLLFSDNFDFQTKDDFIKGILENEEILGNTIHMCAVKNQYAGAVTNFYMYDAVSKDIIERWVHPFTPDNNFLTWPRDCYSYSRHNIYQSNDVTLATNSTLKQKSVIGPGSTIGSGSTISQSVIGRNCVIGDNVNLENAYLWDNVKIDDNCSIKLSILAEGVHLLENVVLSSSCILSYNVVVGPDITLPPGTVLSDKKSEDDFGDDLYLKNLDIGGKGEGFVYVGKEKEMKYLRSRVTDEIYETDDDVLSSNASDIDESDDGLDDNHLVDDAKLFYNEVLESVVRAIDEKNPCDTLVLVINSSRHAYNVTISERNAFVMLSVMEAPLSRSKQPITTHQEYFVALKPVLIQMIPVLRNYVKEVTSQVDCLQSMEDFFVTRSNLIPSLLKTVQLLYDNDVMTEEAIIQWHDETDVTSDQVTHKTTRKIMAPFIQWLKDAEEESD